MSESPPRARQSPAPAPAAGPSDAALVAAARAGERWAQEALFLRHVSYVSGVLWRLVPNRADLDDMVQDVFFTAFVSLHKLENPQAFASWIASMAVRLTHKRLRRQRIAERLGLARRGEVSFDDLVGDGCPQDVAVEVRQLYRQVEALPVAERVALLLRRVEGMSLDEVAAATGASLATVKRRIAAAEERLSAKAGRPRKGA